MLIRLRIDYVILNGAATAYFFFFSILNFTSLISHHIQIITNLLTTNFSF